MDEGFHLVPIDCLVNTSRLAGKSSELDVHHHVCLVCGGQLLQGELRARVSGGHLLNVQGEGAAGDQDGGEQRMEQGHDVSEGGTPVTDNLSADSQGEDPDTGGQYLCGCIKCR